MTVNWATTTNPWLGVCLNSTSAQKVAEINQTIQSCGQVIEPPQGIIPPNSTVILVTSINMDPTFNSFAGLSETIYMIFQCGNTTTGHFANFGAGARTLTISFGAGCSDQVTYDRSLLVNQSGNPGAADGATVVFTPAGVASYINNGCNAPFTPISAAWTLPNGGVICQNGSPVNLNSLVTGVQGGTWSGQGVSGSIFDPSGLSGQIQVTYSVTQGQCSLAVSQNFNVIATPQVSLTEPPSICVNQVFNLNSIVNGTMGGVWTSNGGQITGANFVSPNQGSFQITYTVGTSGCSATESTTLNVNPTPAAPVLVQAPQSTCAGQTVSVEVSSSAQLVNWYTSPSLTTPVFSGNTTYTFNLTQSTTLYIVASEGSSCNSSPLEVILNAIEAPPAPQVQTSVEFCEGDPIPAITATGASGNIINWYFDSSFQTLLSTGATYTPAFAGIFYVTQQNGQCPSIASTVTVTEIPLVLADISINGNLFLCNGETVQLVSGSAISNVWSTGDTTQTITVSTTQQVILTVQGACNTATDTVNITAQNVNASFTANVSQPVAPAVVQFTTQPSDGTCSWLVNGTPVVIIGNELNLTEPGTYTFIRNCLGDNECSSTATQIISLLNDKVELSAPNSFTPNGDGFNDVFVVKMAGMTEASLSIFNRWGSNIYEQKGLSLAWDGNTSAGSSPDGVYFFIIRSTDIFGKEHQKTGHITLIRKPAM
jgi:gliding motility-associated-like protein